MQSPARSDEAESLDQPRGGLVRGGNRCSHAGDTLGEGPLEQDVARLFGEAAKPITGDDPVAVSTHPSASGGP